MVCQLQRWRYTLLAFCSGRACVRCTWCFAVLKFASSWPGFWWPVPLHSPLQLVSGDVLIFHQVICVLFLASKQLKIVTYSFVKKAIISPTCIWSFDVSENYSFISFPSYIILSRIYLCLHMVILPVWLKYLENKKQHLHVYKKLEPRKLQPFCLIETSFKLCSHLKNGCLVI
jgi:hypothetical protein